ncbi:hypothetical protein L195_g047355, partial [Trifolium pratense]
MKDEEEEFESEHEALRNQMGGLVANNIEEPHKEQREEVKTESEGLPHYEASSNENMQYFADNLKIDFHEESVVHSDVSKAVVKVTDDNFPNIHQFIDIISVDLVPKFGDENRERVPSITPVPARSTNSHNQPLYEPFQFMLLNQPLSSSVLPTDSEGSSRQQLYQPLSHICELPPPPKPPDRVFTPMSSVNLSLLVTTTKHFHFSILQTSLQLFDEMPECHITVWSAIINRCMDNEQVLAY